MIIEKRISAVRLVRLIWLELLGILIVAAIPVIVLIYFDLGRYAINASIPLVIGTAIAIFLGFRTNSAYERWWEARRLWGSIINDSRSLIRLTEQYLRTGDTDQGSSNAGCEFEDTVQQICYRQIAWAKLLDRRLKNLPYEGVAADLVGEQEWRRICSKRNPPLTILSLQSKAVRDAAASGLIDTRQAVLLEETISRISDSCGGCERIKATVFPVHYTYFTRVFIWIFLLLLGFSLPAHENANYMLIPAIFLIGWVFFMVEGIGNYMQDPFENNRNVVPTEAMARTIEIDLREAIGEGELPAALEPIDGALY